MVGTTAQLIALACHFNGHARGLAAGVFFPANSTCTFCEYIRFVRHGQSGKSQPENWDAVAQTPDEWLVQQARPGRTAFIVHQGAGNPDFSDRMSAGFVGGGGRWLLALVANGRADIWESGWDVGNREAADQRIWRVRYGLIAEQIEFALPKQRSSDEVKLALCQTLANILAFSDQQKLEGFSGCFTKAIQCLSSDDPFASVYHKDLAPEGLLGLSARQLLAACQAAWVFGGMGSWNDMGFDGEDQVRYEKLSNDLFSLLNEGICVGVNSAVAKSAGPSGIIPATASAPVLTTRGIKPWWKLW